MIKSPAFPLLPSSAFPFNRMFSDKKERRYNVALYADLSARPSLQGRLRFSELSRRYRVHSLSVFPPPHRPSGTSEISLVFHLASHIHTHTHDCISISITRISTSQTPLQLKTDCRLLRLPHTHTHTHTERKAGSFIGNDSRILHRLDVLQPRS